MSHLKAPKSISVGTLLQNLLGERAPQTSIAGFKELYILLREGREGIRREKERGKGIGEKDGRRREGDDNGVPQ